MVTFMFIPCNQIKEVGWSMVGDGCKRLALNPSTEEEEHANGLDPYFLIGLELLIGTKSLNYKAHHVHNNTCCTF